MAKNLERDKQEDRGLNSLSLWPLKDKNVARVKCLYQHDPASTQIDKSYHTFCACKSKKEGSMQINAQYKVSEWRY